MTRGGSQRVRSPPDTPDPGLGQVLPFRRPGDPRPAFSPARPDGAEEADDDLARYEQDPDEHIDYRQRALMNVIALAIVTLLISTGVWLADTIADMQRNQDCVLQGRQNCAPITVPRPKQR